MGELEGHHCAPAWRLEGHASKALCRVLRREVLAEAWQQCRGLMAKQLLQAGAYLQSACDADQAGAFSVDLVDCVFAPGNSGRCMLSAPMGWSRLRADLPMGHSAPVACDSIPRMFPFVRTLATLSAAGYIL